MVQRQLIKRASPTIFDVGANVGVVAAQYRSLFPGAIIHCFEPFAESYKELQERFAGDKSVLPHQVAVCESTGRQSLYSNSSALTNSLLSTDPRAGAVWGKGLVDNRATVEVDSTTLDHFCAQNAIDMIDILKLDIQGSELMALQGAASMLSRQSISLIYLEVILGETYANQPRLVDYLDKLNSQEYELLDFYNPVRRDMRLIQMDAIFLSKNMKEAWQQRLAQA